MKILLIYVLIFTSIFCFSSQAKENFGSFDKPMVFSYAGNGGNCDGCEWFSGVGIITEDTPKQFLKFIKKHPYRLMLFLHSPGGNLSAGLKLGRLLRKYKLSTWIGYTQEDEFGYSETQNGVCVSACAYAFLGGITRTILKEDVYGLHQFYKSENKTKYKNNTKVSDDFLSTEQILSGIIADYLDDMGVSPKVLLISSLTGKDSFISLKEEELKTLRITTDFSWSNWDLQTIKGNLIMEIHNSDPESPTTNQIISCYAKTIPMITIITKKTQDMNSEEIKNTLNNIVFNTEKEQYIPLDMIFTVSTKDNFIFNILLTQNQKNSVINNKYYSIEFDTARYVFGIYGGLSEWANFSKDDMDKLNLIWSGCK